MHWLLHFQVKQKIPFLFETPLLKLVKPRFTAIGLKFQSERAGERSAVSSLCHLFLIKYGNPQNAEILHTPIQFQTFIPSFLSSISASLIWLPSTCFSFHILEWKWLKSVRSFPHFLPRQPHVSACFFFCDLFCVCLQVCGEWGPFSNKQAQKYESPQCRAGLCVFTPRCVSRGSVFLKGHVLPHF